MKRDDWKLGNDITAGDDAWLVEDGKRVLCHVLKVRGGTIKGYESGNVLIEIGKERRAVLGSVLEPADQTS